MTMSVGLGRIVVDPSASVLVRKALGALSTPGLLVDDTGLTIDDNGRIIVRLKADGGLVQDADGLYLETTVGIDSHVDLVSDEYDREWNARLTGTAPNFIESRLLIGSELENNAPGLTAVGQTLDTPMVNIWNSLTQLRLSFNEDNFTSLRVNSGGELEVFSIGSTTSAAGVHLITGDGTIQDGIGYGGLRINGGDQIEIVEMITLSYSTTGGGGAGVTSFESSAFTITGKTYPKAQTVVCGGPTSLGAASSYLLGWSLSMLNDNEVTIRIGFINAMPGSISIPFQIALIRFRAE